MSKKFKNTWKQIFKTAELLEKAERLSMSEIAEVRRIIIELQGKEIPSSKIITRLQESNSKLSERWKAERAYWTEVKRDDTTIIGEASEEIDVTKFKVILPPHACKTCVTKTNNGNKIFKNTDIQKSGYGHVPPFHPNAVLEGSTFATYGKLNEMVGADYEGTAILIKTSEGKNLTIGPNHPILTQRGFVRASDLTVLDYLVYDSRCDNTPMIPNSDLKQMPFVEDAFSSLLLDSSLTLIPPSADYFHGDGIFCKGEINVIKPADGLLFKINSSGLEKISENNLMWSDVKSVSSSRSSSSDLGGDTIFLPTPSGISGVLSSTFDLMHIHSIHYVEFEGKAFDATTETGVYNSNGFVVKNCYCILIPVE